MFSSEYYSLLIQSKEMHINLWLHIVPWSKSWVPVHVNPVTNRWAVQTKGVTLQLAPLLDSPRLAEQDVRAPGWGAFPNLRHVEPCCVRALLLKLQQSRLRHIRMENTHAGNCFSEKRKMLQFMSGYWTVDGVTYNMMVRPVTSLIQAHFSPSVSQEGLQPSTNLYKRWSKTWMFDDCV